MPITDKQQQSGDSSFLSSIQNTNFNNIVKNKLFPQNGGDVLHNVIQQAESQGRELQTAQQQVSGNKLDIWMRFSYVSLKKKN